MTFLYRTPTTTPRHLDRRRRFCRRSGETPVFRSCFVVVLFLNIKETLVLTIFQVLWKGLHAMLILASASPRRRELLTQAALSFTVEAADLHEDRLPDEAAAAYAQRL